MEILTTNGYSGTNYGAWLNKIMESSPSEWVMFHDHDVILFPGWFEIAIKNIETYKDAGLFTCLTNRIGNPEQKINIDQNNHDILFHYKKSEELINKDFYTKEADRLISGLVMLTSKTAWKECGGFRERGIIGVDNDYHSKINKTGYKTYIMMNFYVYHRYRAK